MKDLQHPRHWKVHEGYDTTHVSLIIGLHLIVQDASTSSYEQITPLPRYLTASFSKNLQSFDKSQVSCCLMDPRTVSLGTSQVGQIIRLDYA
jgi:hypothetical protein